MRTYAKPVQSASHFRVCSSLERLNVVRQRDVELDIEIPHLGALTDRVGWYERNVGRESAATEHLHLIEVHGARKTTLAVVVTLLDWQSVVGDQHLDAGPATDDVRFDIEHEPPPRRCLRAAVDARDEVLSKRRFLDQVVVGEVRAHPGAEHRRWWYANRAGDSDIPEIAADAEGRSCAHAAAPDQDEKPLSPRSAARRRGCVRVGAGDADPCGARLERYRSSRCWSSASTSGGPPIAWTGAPAHENRSGNKHGRETTASGS
jgi:hypothetical protein